MCLGLCPTAVWFPCDLEAVSPGLSSRQGDRCPQETNVLRSTSVGTVTFCDANHIFSCIYQKLSFESDDNFGCRLMHADGCQRWETALLLSGKNMCPHYVVLARPHRTPVPHSCGARNSIRVVKYQILFLLLKGKCIHWDILIISTHVFSDSHSWCFTFIPSLSISGYNLQMPPMRHYVSWLWVFAPLLNRTEVLLRRDVMLQQNHT